MADKRLPALAVLLGALVLVGGVRAATFLNEGQPDPLKGCSAFAGVYGDLPEQGIFCVDGPFSAGVQIRRAGDGCLLQAGGPAEPGVAYSVDRQNGICEIRQGRLTGAEIISLGMKLDVNSASAEDLEALPGIGPVLAGRISGYRISNGPFKDVESLSEVRGVGPALLEGISGLITVSAATGR